MLGAVSWLGLIGALSPVAAFLTVITTWQIAKRRLTIDGRETVIEERRVGVEEARLAAEIRQELRVANVALQTQVSALTTDNALLHKRAHDLANDQMVLQFQVNELTRDRDECRKDLQDVLFAVNALEQGRDQMIARLSALEDTE